MEIDTRMILQQSGFTVHGTALAMEDLEYHDEILMGWDIPSNAKDTLSIQLSALGVNESTLFPDLEHLGKYLAGLSFSKPH